MDKYKPLYLGKVIPADNPSQLSDFVNNKYEAFSKIYDTCKEQSSNISDIKVVENGSTNPCSLSVKISTDTTSLNKMKENVKGNESIEINNDVITARS
jgi:hypothetical protein